jgi:diacylglycerol kinase (ATP)
MDQRRWLPTSSDSRELLLCYNPSAGVSDGDDRIKQIEAELIRGGYAVRTTTSPAEIRELAAAGARGGNLRAVIACGGDGTANLVRKLVSLEIPLLPLPMGTECLLSRYLSQSALPPAVRETLDQGVTVSLDLGRATDGAENDRYFLMMISAGFDAAVVRAMHQTRRGNISRSSYLQPIWRTIRSYEYPEIQIYCGQGTTSARDPLRCRWLFGFNLPLYALGWQFAPQASGVDGQLDLCTFRRGSLFDGVRYLWHVVRQQHHMLPDAQLTVAKRVRIEGADGSEIPYQLDGDFAGVLPVTLEVIPDALKLLVMPSAARRLGFMPPANVDQGSC